MGDNHSRGIGCEMSCLTIKGTQDFSNTSQVRSNAYGEKKTTLASEGLLMRNLFPSAFSLLTTTVSHTAGNMWLGTTLKVSLGHVARERVAGVD